MKKINKWIYVFLLFLLVTQFIFSVTLIASEKDLIAEALYYLEQQNYKMAADILEKTLTLIWNKAPLELNNLCFTKKKQVDLDFILGEMIIILNREKTSLSTLNQKIIP